MKFRKHHNNKGYRQIKNGTLKKKTDLLIKKLKRENIMNNENKKGGQFEAVVSKTERDIWNKAIEAAADYLENNAQKINNIMVEEREILSEETLEHFRFDKEFSRNLSASIRQKLLK